MTRHDRNLTTLVLALVLAAGLAAAQVPYLPLNTGNTWTYVNENGNVMTKLVTGQLSIFDHDAWVIGHPVGDPSLENYWTEGADGDVLLHGFWRGWGYVYEPPIVLADAPLGLGATWSSTFDRYTLPDLVYDGTYTMTFEVQEAGTIVVPAGSFEAYGVGTVEPPVIARSGDRYALTGELLQPGQRDASEWWSLGVGEVQFQTIGLYQLESYQIGSVAVENHTWSGVKRLFD